jgi:hypothetical protein
MKIRVYQFDRLFKWTLPELHCHCENILLSTEVWTRSHAVADPPLPSVGDGLPVVHDSLFIYGELFTFPPLLTAS